MVVARSIWLEQPPFFYSFCKTVLHEKNVHATYATGHLNYNRSVPVVLLTQIRALIPIFAA
jgi:hypothetical protein